MQFVLRHRTKITALVVTVFVIVWAVYAYQDKNFWTDAAQSGMAEVALGNLGRQKAQSDKVKQFAQQMVTDHSAVNAELKSAASGKNVTLPADLSIKQRSTYDKLNGLSGTDFDREFMKVMVKDHQTAVKLFEKQSRNDADADAKSFAAKHLPALQSHLQMAQSIYDEIRRSSKENRNGGSNRNANSNSR